MCTGLPSVTMTHTPMIVSGGCILMSPKDHYVGGNLIRYLNTRKWWSVILWSYKVHWLFSTVFEQLLNLSPGYAFLINRIFQCSLVAVINIHAPERISEQSNKYRNFRNQRFWICHKLQASPVPLYFSPLILGSQWEYQACFKHF